MENKTQATEADVDAFIAGVADDTRRADAVRLCGMLARVSGEPARMWGPSIIGFGRYRYRYDSGREGEMARIGFSPRKPNMVVYLADGFPHRADLLSRLGKHSTGKACLYLGRLNAVDMDVLEELARASLDWMTERYPTA